MKKGIITLLALLICTISFAQLQSVATYRIANTTTAFGYGLPNGTEIFDTSTGDMYILLRNVQSTETMSSLIANVDYRNLANQDISGKLNISDTASMLLPYLKSFTETDPTIYSWAKSSTKPTYTASEVGADNYGYFNFEADGTNVTLVGSHGIINFASGTNITLTKSSNTITIASTGSMVYPGAGIAVSTGTGWGTSIADNSANWNTAYSWGNPAGVYLPLSGGTMSNTNIVTNLNAELWGGHSFGTYIDQPILTSSSPVFYKLYLNAGGLDMSGNIMAQNILPQGTNLYDIGSSANYFSHIYTNNLYVYGTGNFSGNVTVGVNLSVTGTSSATYIDASDSLYSLKIKGGTGIYTGSITASDFILSSDSTLKRDIKPIKIDVSKIPLIQFKFKADTTRERYGVIAQLLQKVDSNMVYKGDDGKLKVSYLGFILVRLANDESRIDSLKTVVTNQHKMLNELLKRVKALEDEK